MSMGQYYRPYAQYSPYGYQQPVYTAIAPQTYNERYYSYWLQPIDQSEMPDTPIPGFQGLGANPLGALPMWMKIALGLGAVGAAYFIFKKK
jgi:hypothetical protein